MINDTRIICACAMVGVAISSSLAQQAQRPTAELAKKCREMAVKAHPTQLAGTTPYAALQREYFRQCVAKGGNMDKSDGKDG